MLTVPWARTHFEVHLGLGRGNVGRVRGCDLQRESLSIEPSGTAKALCGRWNGAIGAFSNPRMSLKWAKAEKVSLLGEDLLSKG